MSDLTVRKAESRDAPEMAALSGMLGYPVDGETMQKRLEKVDQCEDRAVFVAEAGAKIVGWIEVAEHNFLVVGRMSEICGLVVAEGQRMGGIGRRLIAAAEKWAGDRGLDQLTVRSNVARTESHPFYEKVGYTRIKSQHLYRKALAKG